MSLKQAAKTEAWSSLYLMRKPVFMLQSVSVEPPPAEPADESSPTSENVLEPFPADGEPVFTTHPAFTYDEGLRSTLATSQLYFGVVCRVADQSDKYWDRESLEEDKAWLLGEIPIPPDRVEDVLRNRERWLKKRGLPTDTPIEPHAISAAKDQLALAD